MTISSSLQAGVAGLNANANRLAGIADNIANSSTYGYKRAETDFFSFVVQGSGSSSYTAGGVRTSSVRMIDDQGPLIGSDNSTDLAVDGRGFIAVTDISALPAGSNFPLSLMTTGSFRLDDDGILRTQTGQVLMGWPANADGTVGTFPRDSFSGMVPVQINENQAVANPTSKVGLGVNLPFSSTKAGAAGTAEAMSVEYFGNLGNSESLDITFTPTVAATGASNTWTMTITDSASGGAVIGEYELTFSSAQTGGGTLASVTATSGAAYDSATGIISLAVGGGTIALDVGKLGVTGGLSQLDGNFSPVNVTKDGSPVATISSLEVDDKGNLLAIYNQGFTRTLYQIPVVNVPNPNGLMSASNQTYKVSPDSGAISLWDAGTGPVGKVVGFSREESTTDVANELTQLIQTQRAYSSNAKVIQTVDEMLQETANLKR